MIYVGRSLTLACLMDHFLPICTFVRYDKKDSTVGLWRVTKYYEDF